MLNPESKQIAPSLVMAAESISEEESTEYEDDDNCSETKESQPVGAKFRSHVVEVGMAVRWGCRWLNVAVTREYCSSITVVRALNDNC